MVLSLVTLRQSGRKIFIRQHCLVQKSAVDLDFSNCDLKIHSELLLSRGNHCNTFGNFQAKGWKDTKWTTLSLQTKWATERCYLFFKGGIKRVTTSTISGFWGKFFKIINILEIKTMTVYFTISHLSPPREGVYKTYQIPTLSQVWLRLVLEKIFISCQ